MDKETKSFNFDIVFAILRKCPKVFDSEENFIKAAEELLGYLFNKKISYQKTPLAFVLSLEAAQDYLQQEYPELKNEMNYPECFNGDGYSSERESFVAWKLSRPELFEKMIEIRPIPQDYNEFYHSAGIIIIVFD